MTDIDPMDAPLIVAADGKPLSMRDLLNKFDEFGSMRVSDLHLKAGHPPLYRVDGQLRPMSAEPISAEVVEKLGRSLLSDIERSSLDNGRSVDSSCFTDKMQFRVNCFYDNDGLAVAIRALDKSPPPVERVGFPNNVWQDIIERHQGLVLVTGITGAGKSTTIASMINRIAQRRACRIITLEDPIEYLLQGEKGVISQREVGRDVTSFERGLRDALREDPDVIFVGEMRDRESAAWTLTAAETGHLVFSTLHTRDVRGAVTRLMDMFPDNRQDEIACQLALGMIYIIAQKLIPRRDGRGRVVAMEILNNTYAAANLIRTRKLEQLYSILQTRTRNVPQERMTTMERSLARLVAEGVVAPLEAEKWAEDRAAFIDELTKVQKEP